MPADSGHFSTLRAPDGELSFNIKKEQFLLLPSGFGAPICPLIEQMAGCEVFFFDLF